MACDDVSLGSIPFVVTYNLNLVRPVPTSEKFQVERRGGVWEYTWSLRLYEYVFECYRLYIIWFHFMIYNCFFAQSKPISRIDINDDSGTRNVFPSVMSIFNMHTRIEWRSVCRYLFDYSNRVIILSSFKNHNVCHLHIVTSALDLNA